MKLLSADLTSNPFCKWLMCPVANDFAHLLHNTGLAFNPAKPRKSYRALRWLLWRPVYIATCTTGLCPWLFIPWNLLDPYLLSSSLVILRSDFPSQLRVFHYEVYNSPDHFIPWFFHGPFPLNHRIRTAGDHDDGVETQAKALGSIERGNILDISFALEQPGVFLWGGWR